MGRPITNGPVEIIFKKLNTNQNIIYAINRIYDIFFNLILDSSSKPSKKSIGKKTKINKDFKVPLSTKGYLYTL